MNQRQCSVLAEFKRQADLANAVELLSQNSFPLTDITTIICNSERNRVYLPSSLAREMDWGAFGAGAGAFLGATLGWFEASFRLLTKWVHSSRFPLPALFWLILGAIVGTLSGYLLGIFFARGFSIFFQRTRNKGDAMYILILFCSSFNKSRAIEIMKLHGGKSILVSQDPLPSLLEKSA